MMKYKPAIWILMTSRMKKGLKLYRSDGDAQPRLLGEGRGRRSGGEGRASGSLSAGSEKEHNRAEQQGKQLFSDVRNYSFDDAHPPPMLY